MIHPFLEHAPDIHPSTYIAPGAHVIGQVSLAENSSIWYNSVVRGDINSIRIGKNTNIQDLSVLHVTLEDAVVVGDDCVVGHAVRLHGCTVQNRCLIGIGAIVLNRAVVGEGCIVGAGALVPEGMQLEAGHLYLGIPCKKIRALTTEERDHIVQSALNYVLVARGHKQGSAAKPGNLEGH